MARYKNGINGPVSGKVGSVIASRWRGIDYLKSLNDIGSKSCTAAQLLQQQKFALVSRWLKPLKPLILLGYQSFKAGKTPMNAAISQVMREAVVVVDGKPEIDFSKVVLSRGELLISLVLGMVLTGDVLRIRWENAAGSSFCKPGDRAVFVFYSVGCAGFAVFEGQALRSDREVQLSLPPDFTAGMWYGYMFYVNEEGDMVSTSQYITFSDTIII